MQISNVASMTRAMIAEQGFEGYQPTVIFPDRRDIRSLAGVPGSEDHEQIALRWASGLAEPGEEYFVVYGHSDTEFKVVHIREGKLKAEVFAVET